MRNFWVLLFCVSLVLLAVTASGHVVLIGKNVALSFDDLEANFASSLKGSAKSGKLYVAEPLDACSVLVNEVDKRKNGSRSAYVLIIRGGCSFEDKVRRAQSAGFKAAIVYDNEYEDLVAMAGNRDGIKIAAVFVSKPSGETLAKYAAGVVDDVDVWIVPVFENSAWSIMAISFISLLAMSAMLATCFFVRRHRVRRSIRSSRVEEFRGMSRRLVKAMPSLIFTQVMEDNSTSGTCAICLEDYNVGEKLRILPCRHKFHAMCVDFWLTSRRTFCPVCKRDARSSNGGDDPPASESTPLLLASSSSSSSSFRSSLATSPPILIINAASFRSNQQSIPSFNQSLHLTGSRSSVDLSWNASSSSSQRSRASYLTTSTNPPVISSLNSRHLCPYYIPRSSPGTTVSSSYLGSSSQHHHPYPPLHYSESATSFSPFASAQSLPGC